MGCNAEVVRLDGALAARARAEAAVRLRLGQALEVLSRGGVSELGFSSLGAYAVERCERGVRWAEVARGLARKAEGLPDLRHGIARGEISWSMGELLARVAQPEDEARWIEWSRGRTVRQMRVLVARAGVASADDDAPSVEPAGALSEASVAPSEGSVSRNDASVNRSSSREMCTLRCTVDQEDAWLFEATRSLLEQLGARGADAMEALLAEAQGTLLAQLPGGVIELESLLASDAARERWLLQLGVWRDEAEAICEKKHEGWQDSNGQRDGRCSAELDFGPGSVAVAAAGGMAPLEGWRSDQLDALVRALAQGLARHELEFARLLLRFHRADGWRQLGYASETQFARERLGLSRSSVLARRSLASRLEGLPGVARALGAGQIGIEAALQVVRVATPRTEDAWLARARGRTIKHLREEVAAALVAVTWSREEHCPPPLEAEVDAFQALERAVVSGRVLLDRGGPVDVDTGGESPPVSNGVRGGEPASEPRRAWLVMLASLAAWLDGGRFDRSRNGSVQTSAVSGDTAPSRRMLRAGRVTLRLRMSREAGAWWRRLEALALPYLPPGMSWLRFACLALWGAWQHLFGAPAAYGHIYVRDRCRCTSPVCCRRDVTPHHIQFRSAGGSDADFNIASLCTWCHLFGVHGGHIRARGTARHIHWELGAERSPCLVVDGRERVAA